MTSGSRRDEDRRGEADRGGGVARLGLEEDVLVGDAGQLLLDRGPVRTAGDDGDAVGPGERLEPIPGVAQQRLARAGEVVQELGGVGARERPQPAADSAGGDDGVEVLDGLGHAPRVAVRRRVGASQSRRRRRATILSTSR